MIATVTPKSSPETWRSRFDTEKVGLIAVATGLALVRIGQRILEAKRK
jgi:hypothetical protein